MAAPVAAALVVAGLLTSASAFAETPTSTPTPADEEGPFAPVIRDLGRSLGVDLRVGRVAINPLIGAVVLRDVEATSVPQGRFLTARRVVARLEVASGGGDAHTVDVEGARLSLDLSKSAAADEREGERTGSGRVRLARLRDLSVELRDGERELLVAEGIGGRAREIAMCAGGDAEGVVCGAVVVDGGTAMLGGKAGIRLESLALEGTLKGRRLRLASLTGDIGGGTIRCDGVVTVFEAGRDGTKLSCHLEGVRITREGVFDLLVSGHIRVIGKRRGLRVSGTVDAVGGNQLGEGRWGKAGRSEEVSVDLRVRVAAPSGRVEARIRGGPEAGRVTVGGRKARSAAHLRRLLSELDVASDRTGPDAGAKAPSGP